MSQRRVIVKKVGGMHIFVKYFDGTNRALRLVCMVDGKGPSQ